MKSDRWSVCAAVAAVLVLAAAGCAKKESRQETNATDSIAARESRSSAELPGAAPSESASIPVGRSDSLINAIAPKIAPWVAMWLHAEPEFEADSLIRVGTASAFRGATEQPLKSFYPPPEESEPVFLILSAHSPDSRYNLIFDWYQHIEETGEEIDIGGDADSGPLLLDLRRGTASLFGMCGTPCGYHWGIWISPSSFALAGWQEADASSRSHRGRLEIYSLADSTVTTYVTRVVPSKQFALYRATWEKWVATKFRALKTPTPRS